METVIGYLVTGVVFFIIFSVIILIHEGGHFWAARFGKIGVEEFGFGLPPRAWGKKNKKSGVLYSLNWIPFGGFVRMLGEDDPNNKEAAKNPHAFNNRPLWARIFAVSAGVIMNFILGWLLLFVGYAFGTHPLYVTGDNVDAFESKTAEIIMEPGAFVTGVVEGSPAANSGILPGDIITYVDTKSVTSREEFLDIKSKGMRGNGYHVDVLRKNLEAGPEGEIEKAFTAILTPNEQDELGVFLLPNSYVYQVSYPIHAAAYHAAVNVGRLSILTVNMLGDVVVKIVTQFSVPEGVGGPVAIAKMTHGFVELGDIMRMLQFASLLSISIAVINIMPFPALDGGRLAFLLVEMVTGKRPTPKIEAIIHGSGFILLLLLLFLVTWNDLFG